VSPGFGYAVIDRGDDGVLAYPGLEASEAATFALGNGTFCSQWGCNTAAPHVVPLGADEYTINADGALTNAKPGPLVIAVGKLDPSVTSLRASVDMRLIPGGPVAQVPYLLWDNYGGTAPPASSSLQPTLTATRTTYTVDVPVVQSAHSYNFILYAQGAQFIASRVRITAIGSTDPFWSQPFTRFSARSSTIQDSRDFPFVFGNLHSVNARLLFVTDETSYCVDLFDHYGVGIQGGIGYAVRAHFADGTPDFVDHYEPTGVTSASPQGVMLAHCGTLPAGHKYVEFTFQGTSVFSVGNGQWARGVSFAKTQPFATVMVAEPATSRKLLVLTDSSGNNDGVTGGIQHGVWNLVRPYYPGQLVVDGWAGRYFYPDWSTSSAQANWLAVIATAAPTELYIATTNHNEWEEPLTTANSWNAADYEVGLGQALDQVHAARPSMTIYLQSSFWDRNFDNRSIESCDGTSTTINAYGAKIGDYRLAQEHVAAARPWVTYVDGHTILSCAFYSSPPGHPDNVGQAAEAVFYRQRMGLL